MESGSVDWYTHQVYVVDRDPVWWPMVYVAQWTYSTEDEWPEHVGDSYIIKLHS
jgi:hypothetical protein